MALEKKNINNPLNVRLTASERKRLEKLAARDARSLSAELRAGIALLERCEVGPIGGIRGATVPRC